MTRPAQLSAAQQIEQAIEAHLPPVRKGAGRISSADVEELREIETITMKALRDSRKLRKTELKFYLHLLQRHGLFGTSLKDDIKRLYDLIIQYKKHPSEEKQTNIKELVGKLAGQLDQGVKALEALNQRTKMVMQEQQTITAIVEPYCRRGYPDDAAKMRMITSQLRNALGSFQKFVLQENRDFVELYTIVKSNLVASVKDAIASGYNTVKLDRTITYLADAHRKIEKLIETAKREGQLVDFEVDYDQELLRLLEQVIQGAQKEQAARIRTIPLSRTASR